MKKAILIAVLIIFSLTFSVTSYAAKPVWDEAMEYDSGVYKKVYKAKVKENVSCTLSMQYGEIELSVKKIDQNGKITFNDIYIHSNGVVYSFTDVAMQEGEGENHIFLNAKDDLNIFSKECAVITKEKKVPIKVRRKIREVIENM